MRTGDHEFHQLSGPLLDLMADEGLRIAKANRWAGLVIEISAPANLYLRETAGVRCFLRDPGGKAEVDEPSAALLDAANALQDLFIRAGSPLAGATMDFGVEEKTGSRVRRWSFRY